MVAALKAAPRGLAEPNNTMVAEPNNTMVAEPNKAVAAHVPKAALKPAAATIAPYPPPKAASLEEPIAEVLSLAPNPAALRVPRLPGAPAHLQKFGKFC